MRPVRLFSYPAAATLVVLAMVVALPASAADPFYLELLSRGKDSMVQGDLETAVESLEIACFGLLDEPTLLADGLAHLVLAQSESGQGDFRETLTRLLEVERRFEGYSQAELTEGTRMRVDDLFLASYPIEELRRIEAFRPAAERQELEALMAVGPARRRELLTERLDRNPNDVQAHQMLAELETAQGNPTAALPHLEALIDLAGSDPMLVCRRFRAAAMTGRCEIALPDTAICAEDALDPTIAAPVLECLLDSGDLVGATAFLDTLPPAVRTSSGIRKLDKRLTREARAADKLTRRTARDSPPVVEETDTEVSVTDAVLGDADTVPMEEESTDTPANDEGTGTDQLADTEVPPPATAEPPSPCDALRTAVRTRACSAAIEHYPACPEGLGDADIAATILGCLVDTGDVATATTFEESLTQEIRGTRKIRKQDKRLAKLTQEQEKQRAELERRQAEEAALAAVMPDAEPETETTQVAEASTTDVPADAEPGDALEAAESAEIDTPSTPPIVSEPSAAELSAARRELQAVRNASDLEKALAAAAQLAASYPAAAEAQFLAAEAAYRAAQWDHAVRYFQAGGDPGDGRPLLLFYQAVSLFETGDVVEAALSLERALPKIRQTPFVDSYTERIRTAASASDS